MSRDILGFPEICVWWPRAESNHRHADFQSAALPTELLGREPGIIATARALTPALSRRREREETASSPAALVPRQVHPELLQLPVQVRALQARLFRHAGHRSVFLRQVKFEITLLER